MNIFFIILLSLFFLLWVVPLLYYHFTATPEQKQKIKNYETAFEKYPPQDGSSFLGIF